MKDKKQQIWYRYKHDQNRLKEDCHAIIQKMYLDLGQTPKDNVSIHMTKCFYEDLIRKFGALEIGQVQLAISEGIRNTPPPVFVNVPTYMNFINNFRSEERLKRQINQQTKWSLHNQSSKKIKGIEATKVKEIGKIHSNNTNK